MTTEPKWDPNGTYTLSEIADKHIKEEIEEYAQLRANNRFYDQDKPIPIIDKNNLPEKYHEREAYEINNGLSTEEEFTIN